MRSIFLIVILFSNYCVFSMSSSFLSSSLVPGNVHLNEATFPLSESRLSSSFSQDNKRAQLVAYITAGYPHPDETVDLLLSMQAGGANVLELGVPFTDPQADGATIQKANEVAIMHGVTLDMCIDMVAKARSRGLTVPVVLMGYTNPFLSYGTEKLMDSCQAAGVDGFIVVDMPPEEGQAFVSQAQRRGLSYVPLVSPATSDKRISFLSSYADSFMYCVSVTGITGARAALPSDLTTFLERVRDHSNAPLAVGFGIGTAEQVKDVSEKADGVVVGSAIISTIEAAIDKTPAERAKALRDYITSLSAAIVEKEPKKSSEKRQTQPIPSSSDRSFGDFGGRYIPETLIDAHTDLEAAYADAMKDPSFHEQLAFYRKEFIGGPTPLYFAENLTKKMGGARIWLKREDLAHTGAHKINNAVGQALLAKRLGKRRIIAETGAGQHGVATAAVCAHFNLDCTVYMGAVDCERQKLNVFRMQCLGAKVVPVESGSRTLKDAINEAMRDWVTNVRDTHYIIGSAIGPHPFPTIVRDFQSVMGREARQQMLDRIGKLPDAVVACVGGGSNAIGMFHPFVNDPSVQLVGVEAGGDGISGLSSATLTLGRPGVLHGTRTYLLQDDSGQISKTRSISAGLDYPGVGPEHAFLKDAHRAVYCSVNDAQAMEGFLELSRSEGIIPALEPSHAIYRGMQLAKELGPGKDILINISGRGDKDMLTVAKYMGVSVM